MIWREDARCSERSAAPRYPPAQAAAPGPACTWWPFLTAMPREVSLLAAPAIIAGLAWQKRALTFGGALAATAIGAAVLRRGGLPAASALVTFFVTSSALSRIAEVRKARRGTLAQAKGSQRDAWQVLANGAAAAACAGLPGRAGCGAFLGALATAAADTWATEIGLLAPGRPRLITTLRPVAPGTSGGVTLQGTLAGLAGAFVVGTTWAAIHELWPRRQQQQQSRALRHALLVSSTAGVLGSLVDSLLGATLQGVYWCPSCREPTEAQRHPACGQAATRLRGWGWMTNDMVNALATLSGALLGAALGRADD